jgi:hypothetical protein
MREHKAGQRQRVLVWRRAGVDHIAAVLKAFIGRRIEQQRVVSFDDGYYSLARAGHVAADDDPHAMFEDQLLGEVRIAARLALGIETHQLHLAARHAARAIDFLHSERRGLQLRDLDR